MILVCFEYCLTIVYYLLIFWFCEALNVTTTGQFLAAVHEWAKCVGYDDEPPMFGVRAWASYLQCIRNSSYYFSVAELLAMCIVSSVNVIIFRETDSVLSYEGGYFEGRGLPVYVKLDCNTIEDGQVRSHFERLISADVAHLTLTLTLTLT